MTSGRRSSDRTPPDPRFKDAPSASPLRLSRRCYACGALYLCKTDNQRICEACRPLARPMGTAKGGQSSVR